MKPRPEPRALTGRDVVIAVVLLFATGVGIVLTASLFSYYKLPTGVSVALCVLMLIAYPVGLNWSDMRVAIRRRRGRCSSCGYDRRGLAEGVTCPECGTATGE